jgi:hypothetical protein
VACKVPPGTALVRDTPVTAGQEHPLVMTSGAMHGALQDTAQDLGPGDALRCRLHGASRVVTAKAQGARHLPRILG